MSEPFRMPHRVAFHETDTAGIVHFSNFFRYMEVAEVEFLRRKGLHVSWREDGTRFGFPRVSATCDFFKPARFEDLIEIQISIEQIGVKSITYVHEIRKDDELLAKGKITAVCIRVGADLKMESIEIPPDVREKLLEPLAA
jgi:YbgC/YbaW family acyl-CoA thioester hydrolase